MNFIIDTNPWLESVRAAYKASPAYRAIHGGAPAPGTVAAALPKKVEYRPDMPVEEYEKFLGELAEP